NIIDIPASDMTRVGFKITNVDKSINEAVQFKLKQLGADEVYRKMIEYERMTGDGFVSLGVVSNSNINLEEELIKKQVKDIEYIHPFSKFKVQDADINENPFKEGFNDFLFYEVKTAAGKQKVHASRIQHLQTRGIEDELLGTSLIVSCYDPLLIFDNVAWSLGQVSYASLFKVLKSPKIDVTNQDQRSQLQSALEDEFNTSTVAVIGSDDELEVKGPGGSLPNLQYLIKFIWEYLAAAARMPKSHIIGQQQGTITGGQFDSLNYHMRISSLQENYLKPHLKELIDILMLASDNNINASEQTIKEYEIEFNSLWELDEKTEVEIEELKSKIYERYVKNGILTAEEIREEEFENNASVEDVLMMSEEELHELGIDVDEVNKFNEKVEKAKQKSIKRQD
ncbi:MAG: DUF1073 domain-containing protein, partial [Clostridiales bacterium]|nr:DUF1073 domain-containing protein [Clostridiales bacterium]